MIETTVSDIYACGDCMKTFDSCTSEVVMFQREMLTHTPGKTWFLLYPSQTNFIMVKPPMGSDPTAFPF